MLLEAIFATNVQTISEIVDGLYKRVTSHLLHEKELNSKIKINSILKTRQKTGKITFIKRLYQYDLPRASVCSENVCYTSAVGISPKLR